MKCRGKYCTLVCLIPPGFIQLFLYSGFLKDQFRFRDFYNRIIVAENASRTLFTDQDVFHPDLMKQYGICRVTTNTSWPFVSNTSRIRANDWTFTQRVECPTITISPTETPRHKASILCHGGESELVYSMTDSSSDIQIFKPGDECLRKFINACCYDNKPVPNLMHYIWIADVELSFFTFVSFISVVRFMRPCLIMFHGPFIPRGEYWDFFIRVFPNVVLVNESMVTTIYGHKLKYIEHGADVMRIQALLEYGGLYMDWDAALVKPIDPLRKHDCSMSLENLPQNLGNQVIMSKKGGKFLTLWLEGYRNYREAWNFNSIKYPYILAKKYPRLISVQGYSLLVSRPMSRQYLWHKYSNWSGNYALHFFLRGYHNKREVTINSIRTMKTTIAAVIRHILFGSKEQCLE